MSTGIRRIGRVIVAVTNQDRSLGFYEQLGLEKRVDETFGDGGYRWLEVFAPESDTSIALATPPPGQPVTPTQTGITFETDDIEATHAALKQAGLDIDPEISRMGGPVPPMFWLRDPDGHTLLVVQPTQS